MCFTPGAGKSRERVIIRRGQLTSKSSRQQMSSVRLNIIVLVVFVVLTAVVTYPQVTGLGAFIPIHISACGAWGGWRTSSFPIHVISLKQTSSFQLFEANIFFPAHNAVSRAVVARPD
jgi:hypothetical protein